MPNRVERGRRIASDFCSPLLRQAAAENINDRGLIFGWQLFHQIHNLLKSR